MWTEIGKQKQLQVLGAVAVAVALLATAPAVATDVEGTIGPDVVVLEVSGAWDWGASGGTRAYSVGTTSCNRGDVDLDWISASNHHPVIAQNLYRVTLPDPGPPVRHSTIEMLGISWLKHGFVSVNGGECEDPSSGWFCQHPGTGSKLGVGCSDPYSSSLNGSQSRLGPRSEVNAFSGEFVYPYSSPSGDPTLAGRLLVKESEIIDDATTFRYFVEGQYVAPDDAAAGNGLNNASHREVVVTGSSLSVVGPTEEGRPGIYAWRDLDPEVTIREVFVPREGLFIIGFKASDNGDGTWHYEYAVFNLNSHVSARSFSLPIFTDSVVTNIGFRDVEYHSGEPYDGTDWAVDVDSATGRLTWSTDDFVTDPNANALRWSTMYTFRFDADSPPVDALAAIGLYRADPAAEITALVKAPASNLLAIFADGFEAGTTTNWSQTAP